MASAVEVEAIYERRFGPDLAFRLAEALEISGFEVKETIVRFLPFTTKSKLPKSLLMVQLYLRFPLLWRLMGQQPFVVAQPRAEVSLL